MAAGVALLPLAIIVSLLVGALQFAHIVGPTILVWYTVLETPLSVTTALSLSALILFLNLYLPNLKLFNVQ